MPNLITTHTASGKVARRCNAKCYNATESRCTCVCAGLNHGVGLRVAAQHTVKLEQEAWRSAAFLGIEVPDKTTTAKNLTSLARQTSFWTI